MSSKRYPIFNYTESDFNFIVNDNNDNKSKFDLEIIEKWIEAEKNNILRYKLNINNWKRIEGKNNYLAQLNIDRSEKRRKPQDIQSMKMKFNENSFNFNKINDKEIYFDIDIGDGNNVVAVNVSPMEFGHCLVLIERKKNLPQIATELSLLKTVELFLLSKSPYLRIVFNSLCAHASVNHLHWHLMYLNHKMLLETIELEKLNNLIYSIKNYPAKGFCIKLSTFDNNLKKFVNFGYKILNYLQNNEIAHNVYITRAKLLLNYDDVRMYIWGRKLSIGIKDTTKFIPACSELFGHLCIRNEQDYNTLTESHINSTFEDITKDIFNLIKNDIIKMN